MKTLDVPTPKQRPSSIKTDTGEQQESPGEAVPNERTSLLPKSDDPEQQSQDAGNGDEQQSDDRPWRWLVIHEFKVLIAGAIPVILAYTLQMSLQTLSIVIVGRRSPADLATAAFAYMFFMVTACLIGLGGTTAMDTLGSSAFTGSKNPHEVGIILQKAFLVLGVFYIPVVVFWIFAEPFFRALGQNERISHDSARFLWCLIPGGLGYIYFESMKKYLQAQEIMRPGTYVLCITSPLNALLNYLFIYVLKIGLLGAPLATSISYWLSFLLLVGYSRYVKGWQCWGGWSRQCLHQTGTFARLAALGFIHVGTEWWAFEIVALAAGRLGTIPLAAQSVIMTADQIMNTIPFGVGVAASTRVGSRLGARDPKGASRAAHCAAWLSMILGLVVLIILMATKNVFAKIFNDDPQVVKLTAEVLPFVALFQIADGLNGSCGGSLRGMGRQHIGAAVNIVSYYCLALPLGIYLAFNGWGLEGLWVGQCIALYLVGILEWVIVGISNWDVQVKKALKRIDVREESTEAEAENGEA